jgi:hypothetical protein
MESLFLAFQIYGLAIVRVKPPQADAAPSPAAASDSEGIPEAHVAAIAAATHVALGAHRIVHVEDKSRGTAWTFEGRAAHHASHAVPRRPAH